MNTVAMASKASDLQRIADQLDKLGCPWERWTLAAKTGLTSWEKAAYSKAPVDTVKRENGQMSARLAGFAGRSAGTKYHTLISTAIDAANRTGVQALNQYSAFDRLVRSELETEEDDGSFRLSSRYATLLKVNGVLSRHVSQMYFGATPILGQACHYSIHSALGIGTSILAIEKIRDHVALATARHGLWKRLAALSSYPAEGGAWSARARSDGAWDRPLLDGIDPDSARISDEDCELVPLITCFSGRDGFRRTEVSLSVPLEILSNCNTSSWTALTLTHEISHVIVDGFLSVYLPKWDGTEAVDLALETLIAIHWGSKDALNRLEQVQDYALGAFISFVGTQGDRLETLDRIENAESLGLLMAHHWRQFEELLTHVTDFQYFYNQEVEDYVSSIWRSWEMLPSIIDRVDEYLLRTCLAVMSSQLHSVNCAQLAVNRVGTVMTTMLAVHDQSQLLQVARDRIDELGASLVQDLGACEGLCHLVRHGTLLTDLRTELTPRLKGRRPKFSSIGVKAFDNPRISDPVSFVQCFGLGEQFDEAKSLWILSQLAFSELNE